MTIKKLVVGAQNNSDSATISGRGGKQGDDIVSHLHGRYYEQNYRGKVFHVATQALVTTTVGLATTYTGLVLSNPITSTVNLEILTASMMQSVIQSVQVEAYALATGFNSTTNVTHTTPVAVKSSLIGSGLSGTGVADVAATLPTAPFYSEFMTSTASATVNPGGMIINDISGRIILAPGAYCMFVTPAQASVAGLWFSFSWSEVPT